MTVQRTRKHTRRKQRSSRRPSIMFVMLWIIAVAALFYVSNEILPDYASVEYSASAPPTNEPDSIEEDTNQEQEPEFGQIPSVTHIETPTSVKAVYLTTCAASTLRFRDHIVGLIEATELNSIVIDIKDYSGGIGFDVNDPELEKAEGITCFVKDMKEFITQLHKKDIYVIGRITVFQDPFYAPRHPSQAVQRSSDGGIWRDKNNLSFIDPGSQEAWDYTVNLAVESYEIGFDELNFDYIRFPTDGNMHDISFPISNTRQKEVVLEEFFSYLHDQLKDGERFPDGEVPVISADLFGMVTTNRDDLNIGQVLERALPYFDYIAPMVYPSHYPDGFNGWPNPDDYPYDVVEYSMGEAVRRTTATTTPVSFFDAERIGTSTPPLYKKPAYDKTKLRPWIQDFDYGGNYGPAEVRTQIQAVYDVGLDSWMLWDPANRYTKEALKPAPIE